MRIEEWFWMGIEEFASVAREIVKTEIDRSIEDWIVTSIPLGGHKDAKNGYPKIRVIIRGSSPERRILNILDLERIGNGYELVASYTPDYGRAAQDKSDSEQNKILPLSEEMSSESEFLADLDEYITCNVTVQIALAIALGRDKDVRRYNIM